MIGSPRLGNYVLEELIGRGGMAEVFRATAVAGPHAGETVAVKRLLPNVAEDLAHVDTFLGEAEITKQLDHPAIIKVLETGSLNGMHFIAMEFVDGYDLNHILERCVAADVLLPVDFACFVVHTVAEALDYAHHATDERGRPLCIVHCDVTPSNIFVSKMGDIYLGDFGIASSAVIDPMKIFGVVGKAPYLSPEQIQRRPLTPATDVFALGVILFEMLTGRRAFVGHKTRQVLNLVTQGNHTRPSLLRPEVSADLDAVVLRATSARLDAPGQWAVLTALKNLFTRDPPRYHTAKELAAALAPLYDDGVGTPLAIASVIRTVCNPGFSASLPTKLI